MMEMVGLEKVQGKHCIAIGPITEKALIKNNISCQVSKKYTMDGLVDCLLDRRR